MHSCAPLRLLDLFSGIGGFSLGLERSGYFRTVAFCEIQQRPRAVLASHWSGIPIYDDVTILTAERLAADGIGVDAICGGFPCQDISLAKHNALGLDGERSGLWVHYARLIRELRPRLVFVENVSGLVGRGLGRVLGDLATIGYDAEWHCIPASYFGAPHGRDRIWFIAHPHSGDGGALIDRSSLEREKRLYRQRTEVAGGFEGISKEGWLQDWRSIADEVFGVDDGVPATLDGYNALANAVVPAIPEILARVFAPTIKRKRSLATSIYER